MLNVLLIGAGLFALSQAVKLGTTANTADKLQFDPATAKWQGIKSGGLNFDLTFSIINPTASKLVINYLFVDIYLPGKSKITQVIKENWNFEIAKESQTKVTIPVKINWIDLFLVSKDIYQNFKAGKLPDSIQAKGFIKVNKYSVNFDENIKLF